MPYQVVITLHTYIFVKNGHIIEQCPFDTDEAAIEHAEHLEKGYQETVHVARWLERPHQHGK